jgi:hypothetical protein
MKSLHTHNKIFQAIRDSKRSMAISLWCCYIIVCSFHLCCAALLKLPDDFLTQTSNWIIPLRQYLPWTLYIGCSVAFDVLILALSLSPQMEGLKWKPSYSHVAKKFYFDAIMFFGFSLIVSTLDLAWILSHRYNGMLITFVAPM